mgnify:CR=1 FL=1
MFGFISGRAVLCGCILCPKIGTANESRLRVLKVGPICWSVASSQPPCPCISVTRSLARLFLETSRASQPSLVSNLRLATLSSHSGFSDFKYLSETQSNNTWQSTFLNFFLLVPLSVFVFNLAETVKTVAPPSPQWSTTAL